MSNDSQIYGNWHDVSCPVLVIHIYRSLSCWNAPPTLSFSLQISLVFVPLQTTGPMAAWTTFWSVPYTSRFTQHSSRMTSRVRPAPLSQLITCSAPVVPKPRQWYVLTGYWGHAFFSHASSMASEVLRGWILLTLVICHLQVKVFIYGGMVVMVLRLFV